MHPKPDDEAFQAQLDKLQHLIDEAYRKMSDIAREARNKNYLPADKTFEDLISLLKVKQEERKKASDELQAVVAEKEIYQKQNQEFMDKSNDLRFKMKIPGKKTDLEAQLKELKGLQSKGSITMQEEKRLIKEISDLERSLPFAGPLEELEEQSKSVKEQYKILRSKAAQKFETVKLLREECKDIQDKIDKQREEHEKRKEETTPAIEKMKDEYRTQINNLKQKKKDSYDKHNSDWRKYEEQQAEIEQIKFIKRRKEKLLRDEAAKKRHEEWKKQKEIEAEENREIPYRAQLELCDLLIGYCKNLIPAVQENTTEVQKDKNTVISEALQKDEWKVAKGQYIINRKEDNNDFFGGGKNKKTQKKQQQKPKEEEAQSLNHQFETLNYFEEIKISPPLVTSKLPDTLKQLLEKKAYFQKLSDEATVTEEARKNMSEEERKKFDEEEKAKKEAEKEHTKKDNKKKTQTKFDIESEQDFPKM
jgi:hypothetical protein